MTFSKFKSKKIPIAAKADEYVKMPQRSESTAQLSESLSQLSESPAQRNGSPPQRNESTT